MRQAVLLTILLLTGCTSSFTGGVDKVIAQADRSDPIRAAIVDALAVVDQDFAPVMTTPLSEVERAELIESWVKLQGLGHSQSRLDLLRAAEAIADSARHITIEMPGAHGYAYSQTLATGGVEGDLRNVEWRFPIDFADRERVAADLVARIAPLFAVDPKWYRSGTLDPKLNPLAASTSFMTYLEMGLRGASTSVMVTIQYWHDPDNYDAWGGLRIYVVKSSVTTV